MKQFCLILIVIAFSFNFFSCNKNEFGIKIKSTSVKNGRLFSTIEIKNHSDNKVYFPIITTETLIPYHNVRSQENNQLNDLFYPAIILLIYDKNEKIIPAIYGSPEDFNMKQNESESERFDSIGYYLSQNKSKKLNLNEIEFLKNRSALELFKYITVKNESFFINPKSNLKIKIESHLNHSTVRAELLLDDMTFYPVNEFNEETKLSFFINIDSSKVKKNLPPAFIDSLHQNNIKIFHGTISSNKVPLIIKE